MTQKLEHRTVEQFVTIVYCDRCESEIATKRNGGGGLDLQEGANLSARSVIGWVPLIPVEAASDELHGREFNAANVDICNDCLDGLQEWFRAFPHNNEGTNAC